MRNHLITNDQPPLQLVWIFQGDDLPDRRSHHPSAVFTTLKAAAKWVKTHRLSGLITACILDVPAFEYSVQIGGVPEHRLDGAHRQVWGGGEMHYHVKDGVVLGAPTPRRKRVAQLVAVPSKSHQDLESSSGTDNDLTQARAFLERIGFDAIEVLYDPAAAEVSAKWEATVSCLKPGDLALFAYFGHARSHENDDSLLTKDTRLDLIQTSHNAPRLRDLTRISDACAAERVFLLDCCRDSSFVRSQDRDRPSPQADPQQESELIRASSNQPVPTAAASLPAPSASPGPVTTILSELRGERSPQIPAPTRSLFISALLTVAQRRMNEQLAIQIDDDFIKECQGVLRGLAAEHELTVRPTLICHSTTDHRPILVEGRVRIARTSPTPAAAAASSDLFTNSLSMTLARIPAGTFMMGSPATEACHDEDETQHEVTLTKPFFLGITQVTQEQWQALMGSNPSFFRGMEHLPVENVSWDDAMEFCTRLSQKEERQYRLPTEAEWEYACKAGTTTPFNTGMTITPAQANFAVADYDGEPLAPHLSHTMPVASFPPNGFGLYDMHGNVYEWCSDWFDDDPTQAMTDPKGPESKGWRVSRGGSCRSPIAELRSVSRHFRKQGHPYYRTGFRIAMDAD